MCSVSFPLKIHADDMKASERDIGAMKLYYLMLTALPLVDHACSLSHSSPEILKQETACSL